MKRYIKKVIPIVYDFYVDFENKNGYCPSYRVTKEETGICLDYISKSINWLAENGYISVMSKGIYKVNKDKVFKGVD